MKRNHTGHRVGEWHQKCKESDDKVRLARQLRETGMSYQKIGYELDVPMYTIRDWVNYVSRSTA